MVRAKAGGYFPSLQNSQPPSKSFLYYPSPLDTLQIHDAKGVILGYRFKIPSHVLKALSTSSQILDSHGTGTSGGGGGDRLARGLYESRHYSVSVDYGKSMLRAGSFCAMGKREGSG